MAFTRGAYNPTDGIKNQVTYPSAPGSEAAFRKQFQDNFDQAMAAVNALMTALEKTDSGSSGAENIGSALVTGVTGTTVRAQIANLKTQIDAVSAGGLTDGVISDADYFAAGVIPNAAMAANSIDSAQYVDGSIDREHLAADIVDGTKIADDAIDSEHIAAGAIDNEHLSSGCVTNGNIAAGAVANVNLAVPPMTSLWTGTWSTGTITVTGHANYNVFLILTTSGGAIATKSPTEATIEGITAQNVSAYITIRAINISYSSDTWTLNGMKFGIVANGVYPIVNSDTTEITAIYGIC